MATFEELERKIAIKFKTLDLAVSENARIISRDKVNELIKQKNLFEKRLDEINELKVAVEEIMLEAEKSLEEVENWVKLHNEEVAKYDAPMEEIETALNNIKRVEEANAIEQEEIRMHRRMKEMQLQMREETKAIDNINVNCKVKLPKLYITKFNGTHLDWFRFWNQFESDIEKSELSPVSKFSYLKELVSPKVRSLIDGLPFTTEGYTRAKNILEKKYGKPSEVANAHVQNIMSLPHIHNSNPYKIHEFSEKLLSSVQALETMGKIKEINGYVRLTLDKLQGIRADLVRTDDDWQDWKFPQLVEALEKWTSRNPKPHSDDNRNHPYKHPNKAYQTKQQKLECVYCGKPEHKSADCQTVKTTSERRKILSEKKLCFNCTGSKHRASDCHSTKTCLVCKSKHHTSICDKNPNTTSEPLLTTTENNVIYPVAIVKINGIKCHALLNTGSGRNKPNQIRNNLDMFSVVTDLDTFRFRQI